MDNDCSLVLRVDHERTDGDGASPQAPGARRGRGRGRPGITQEALVEVTWRCLREEGYDATTIRRIATRLGCSVGHIYRLFPDKHELLLTVTQKVLTPVLAVLDHGEGFERSLRLYHHRATRDMEAYRLMFWLAGVAPRGRRGGDEDVADDDGEAADTSPPVDGRECATTGAAAWLEPDIAALPPVVSAITGHWRRLLDDADLALQCWAMLHGALMLGCPIATVARMLRRLVPDLAMSEDAVAAAVAGNADCRMQQDKTSPAPRELAGSTSP